MRTMKRLQLILIIFVLLQLISCSNSKKIDSELNGVVVLDKFKTSITRGTGGGGMKISLRAQINRDVSLDSIVYNGKSNVLDQLKKEDNILWVESFYYDSKKMIAGKGLVEYKAEGNTCILYYTKNKKVKSVLITDLKIKQDESTLWE